jgi:glycosyltransferase involved in cell wall biosynthesis
VGGWAIPHSTLAQPHSKLRCVNIVQITPGAGGMYCGGCFRDNALVTALRQAGHETLMIPLYLPLTLDEPDQSADIPIFFSGINVYLEQKSALFRHLPSWLLKPLTTRRLLSWVGGRAARTRAEDLGDITLSMLRGEDGHQARELEQLIGWLQEHSQPDVICLSNALLLGMARELKRHLKTRIVCLLSGEDSFLDALPANARADAWQILTERSRDVDLFLPPSRYFADLMSRRLSLRPEQVAILPNGIKLAGYTESATPSSPKSGPVLGYFARMCPEKGLDQLVDAFLLLKQREVGQQLRLHVGGGCGPGDEPFVRKQRKKLAAAGCLDDALFLPNLTHAEKVAFLRGLTLFSVPAPYNEAFGLYVIEAMAARIPVVQPRRASFPEIIGATGGGVLCEPGNVRALADAIEPLLQHPERAQAMGLAGFTAVSRLFTAERMADNFVELLQSHSRLRNPAEMEISGA